MDKILDSITVLIKLTQKKEITWEAINPPRSNLTITGDSKVEGAVYKTIFKGKYFRLYKWVFKVQDQTDLSGSSYATPSGSSLSSSGYSGFSLKKFPYWDNRIILEITNEEGYTLWTFPEVSSLGDLFAAVQYQAAGVDSLLDEILEEKKE